MSSLIIPERYTIPQSATAIHKITNERALAEGEPVLSVLSRFSEAVLQADIIVGHNVLFDRSIVTAEFARAQQDAPILGLPYHCTMKTTSDICKIPHKSNRQGYKWPTLKELHMHLFGTDFDDAHDALADVFACMRCYLELKKRGLFAEL
ncbi:MAG: 3'-5' exonuclease [Methanospirillaceae archaeon]|nr:3'-5' exonuclease [Methanospirillaceae archaeon]